MWSVNSEVFLCNLKAIITKNTVNYEELSTNVKELGNLEMFPSFIQHNNNG